MADKTWWSFLVLFDIFRLKLLSLAQLSSACDMGLETVEGIPSSQQPAASAAPHDETDVSTLDDDAVSSLLLACT
jgi:hypothetical protein